MKQNILLQILVSAPDVPDFAPLGDQTSQVEQLAKAALKKAPVTISKIEDSPLDEAQQAIKGALDAFNDADGKFIGGQFILSFLGHGTQFAPEGAETSEYWVVQDGTLQDLWVFNALVPALIAGLDIVVVSDCCRGGGMFGDVSLLRALMQVWSSRLPRLLDSVPRESSDPEATPSKGVLLFLAPVSKNENTELGFTADVAAAFARSNTYGEAIKDLQVGWPNLRYYTEPGRLSTEQQVLQSTPLAPFK